MKELAELRGKRSALAIEIKDMLDKSVKAESRWEAANQDQYNAKIAEIDAIDAKILRINDYLERFSEEKTENQLQDHFNSKNKTPESRQLYAKFLRGGDNALTAQEWMSISNTLSVGTSSQGGYTVQSEVAQTLIDALKLFGGMRKVCTVIATEMGNPLSFPTTDGTTEVGEIIAENTTATALDPVFGTVAVNPYKFSSKVVAVPFELLQDSQIDVEAFINKRLIQRLGRITNQMFTTGTGTAQPTGVTINATSGKVGLTGQTLSIIYDDIVDLIHSIDPAYRVPDQPDQHDVAFMMADSSLKILRKLKDTSNRPVYLPGYDGLTAAMGDSLMGYPIVINQDVAPMAANAKSVLFGDFSKYIIRDVMEATMFRFNDSAYAKLGQVGFLMWMRSGGNLTDNKAVAYYTNSAT